MNLESKFKFTELADTVRFQMLVLTFSTSSSNAIITPSFVFALASMKSMECLEKRDKIFNTDKSIKSFKKFIPVINKYVHQIEIRVRHAGLRNNDDMNNNINEKTTTTPNNDFY